MPDPSPSASGLSDSTLAAEIDVQKKQRKACRASATTEGKKLKDFLTVTDTNVEQVVVSVAKLNHLRAKLAEIDKFLLVHGGYADVEAEIEKAEEYQDTLTGAAEILSSRLRVYHNGVAGNASVSQPQQPLLPPDFRKAKLNCDLDLMSFDGNSLHWEEFYDDFVNTGDSRTDYSVSDKFKCLKQALKGEAFDMIRGYYLTDSNYAQAKADLKERFGDPQVAIFAHFQALLDIQPASHELKQLSKVRDSCEVHIRSLIALGLDEATSGQVSCPIILSKLPRFVKTEMHRKNGSTKWDLKNLRELLKDEITARDRAERFSVDPTLSSQAAKVDKFQVKGRKGQMSGNGSTLLSPSAAQKGAKGAMASRSNDKKARCILCNGEHFTDNCIVYPKVEDRISQVKAQKRCFVSLRSDHMKSQCGVADVLKCFHCKGVGHHRSLCYSLSGARTSHAHQSSVNIGVSSQPNPKFCAQRSAALNPEFPAFTEFPACFASNACVANSAGKDGLSRKGQAVMETCVASIRGARCATKARIVFDTASTRSFIRTSAAQAIGAKFLGQEDTSIGRLGETERRRMSYGICSIDVMLPNGSPKALLLSQIESISTPIRLLPLDQRDAAVLASVYMAEGLVLQACDVQLDVLIGLDYYYEFVGPVVASLQSGLVLKSTVIGHIVTGFQVEQWSTQTVATTMLTVGTRENDSCDIERFWSIEEIGIKDDPVKSDDDRALEFFNKAIKFEDGRYQVKWLFREGMAPESDNKKLAEGRLRSLHRRLKQQPDVLKKYDQTIRDQLKNGVTELAPEKPNGITHYIPHHHVVKETSVTTKLRVVYDASAKARKEEHSLNECLYRGPVILADLGGMLMRMRLSSIAMTADIEKAFLQIGLQLEDRDVTRFLWLRDPDQPPNVENIVILRFARVPFGFATSSFLLDGTIAHHLRRQGSALALEVLSDLFVDNVQGGRDTIDEAVTFYKEAKSMFSDAALNLREWFSNSKEFLASVAESDRGEGTVTRFLGLEWDVEADALNVTVGKGATTASQTKRGVLKGIASAYDPCGFFAPAICLGKILMQEIWKQALAWDAKLPCDLLCRWETVQSDLLRLPEAKIPRYVGVKVLDKESKITLHCFCDASGVAYGAAVYLVVSNDSKTSSTLLFAKARVCPLKEISMPRLELIAATLGAKLVRYVRKELRIPAVETYLWTDSKCVLWWIVKDSVKERFVENRLDQIRGPDLKFRYVPTSENPADIASRGAHFDQLIALPLWWSGPPWITSPSERWPADSLEATKQKPAIEETVALASDNQAEVDALISIERFSSLTKLIRVTAQVLRFIRLLKHRRNADDGLQAADLREAMSFWIKRIQSQEFVSVERKRGLKNLFRQLGVYKDDEGFLRCRGRFDNAAVTESAKDPLLLPKNHPFSKMVIEDAHRRVMHSGVKHTLAEVRQEYWIIHGRCQVKRIIYKCRRCRRYQGAPFQVPPPPQLPDFRVSMKRPFAQVGLDYAGPVLLKDGDESMKHWICLFTCASVRAIHLESVTSLSAEHFLLALRRFCALYGVPELIVSDNASQFKSTERLLRKLAKSDRVQEFSANAGLLLIYKFIVEMAPWMGGFYEKMVSPVKKALRRCVGQRLLDSAEFQTILYEITAVVNSRPLAVNEGDEVGENSLTPNHFLMRSKWIFQDAPSDDKVAQGPTWSKELITNWRRLQNVLNSFWSQWQREYLLSLREHFWPKNNPRVNIVQPREGQVVLVSEKNVPRGCWKLARITKLLPSADGLVRSVEVKFANNRISRRAIKLLHPLESSAKPQPIVRRQRPNVAPISPDEDEEYDEELLVSSEWH